MLYLQQYSLHLNSNKSMTALNNTLSTRSKSCVKMHISKKANKQSKEMQLVSSHFHFTHAKAETISLPKLEIVSEPQCSSLTNYKQV